MSKGCNNWRICLDERKMMMKLILGICIVLLLFCATETATAKTWYVDASGGADFTKIQDAVDAANDDDTIIVYSGTYYEHVFVNKQLNLTGVGMPVVDAQGSTKYAIELKASGCVLNGFVAQNSHGPWNYQAGVGIKVVSNGNIISNNNVSKNGFGILIDSSSNNILVGNNVSSGDGIVLSNSNSNTLTNNTVSNGMVSIKLSRSNNNTLTGNIANSNSLFGISFYSSNNNTLTGNIVNLSNGDGISFSFSNNNTLISNNVNSNHKVGIEIYKSSSNNIYLNNLISNRQNVYSENSTNIWNSTSTINYTYNGRSYISYLGNYWDEYTGSDADNDGIADSPYDINGDKDNYPLMKPYSELVGTPEIPEGEEKGIPGFEAVFAIAGLLVVAYVLRRKRK